MHSNLQFLSLFINWRIMLASFILNVNIGKKEEKKGKITSQGLLLILCVFQPRKRYHQ